MKLKLGLMSPVGTCGGLWGEVGPSATPTAAAASGTFTSAGPEVKVQWTHSTWKHILPCWARSELMFPLQEITHFTAIPLQTEGSTMSYAAKVYYLLCPLEGSSITRLPNLLQRASFLTVYSQNTKYLLLLLNELRYHFCILLFLKPVTIFSIADKRN